MIFVTGGAGFIGSNFILSWINEMNEKVINVDKLTYAGNLHNLEEIKSHDMYKFYKCDIGDKESIIKLLKKYKPRAIVNFAAESHVDRSIANPDEFIKTNILGTFNLLNSSLAHWQSLDNVEKNNFRFLHVSTDEVYGSLLKDESPFTELNQYKPNSPYSASKASSDHLVRSYFHTYGLPTLTTNCSNNYGPFHFPEKLIPLSINNAINKKNIPIYGDGQQVRDWLYVDDHCNAIRFVLKDGRPGEVYNIGGKNEIKNLDVVTDICEILDQLIPKCDKTSYKEQIIFVKDRKGHDIRYAIDSSKIRNELCWTPKYTFKTGILKTVNWYIDNQSWVKNVTSGKYKDWMTDQYGNNL